MKVAHVMPRYGPGGGIVQIVRETTVRLRDRGVESEIFTTPLPGRPAEPDPGDGRAPAVRRLAVGRSARLHAPMLDGLVSALSQSGAGIVHAHNHRTGFVLQAAFAARKLGLPWVVSTYYHPAQRAEPLPKKAAIRLADYGFGLVAYAGASALVVLTPYERETVRKFSPGTPIHVVPPGIDLARWTDPGSDLRDPRLPPRYFLYAGRLARTKGIPTLLGAVAATPPSQRLPLVLVGPDMGERPRLEQEAARLGIAADVTFLGHVPDDRTYRGIVRGATALILPSEWESFGIVLLEAMAAKTPVIASAVGALPDVTDRGQAGRLFPFGDARKLAEALKGVVEEPQRTQQMVARGFEKARAADWERASDATLAVYEGAVSGRNAGRAAP